MTPPVLFTRQERDDIVDALFEAASAHMRLRQEAGLPAYNDLRPGRLMTLANKVRDHLPTAPQVVSEETK